MRGETMYGKFIDGKFVRAKYGINDQEALSLGFKPVVLTSPPMTDSAHMPIEWLEETETEIVRHWNIVDIPVDPDPDISQAEVYDIVFGGAK